MTINVILHVTIAGNTVEYRLKTLEDTFLRETAHLLL